MPIIDLLELWSEVFEMKQEKAALYGEPHSQPNPYNPPQHNTTSFSDSQYLGDQTAQKACRASGGPRATDHPASPITKEEEIL